jgi:hypothetical protein
MFGGFPFHILWIPELPFHDCFIRVSCEHHFFSVLCITDALMDGRSPGMEHDPQTPLSSLPAPVCRVKRCQLAGASSFLILMLICYSFCAKHFCTESAKKQKTRPKRPANIPQKSAKRPQIQKTGFLACVYT